MAEGHPCLTGDDLAKPAKNLPLKVIRELGRKLHRQLPMSGNWETLGEDLGYGFEDIHQFSSLASIKRDITPGETMLLDWVQRSSGCTLFVLRSALLNADRHDCVEYLESEIYDKVVCMDLMICVRDEITKQTVHRTVRTKRDLCLIDSLRHSLEEPITDNYVLLDRNASWENTVAREFKGRELMLKKTGTQVSIEQDPTIDSSNPTLGACGKYYNIPEDNMLTRPLASQGYQAGTDCLTDRRETIGESAPNYNGTTNDLGQERAIIRSRSQNLPLNIEDTGKKSTTNIFTHEPYKQSGNVFSRDSQYSDELNTAYAMSIPEPLKVAEEHVDVHSDGFDFSDYQDPSVSKPAENMTESMTQNMTESMEGEDVYKCFVDDARLSVRSIIHDDSLYRDSAPIGRNLNDPIEASVAVYEDPHAYQTDDPCDDDPVYHFATDMSLERDDSLTKIKELAQREFSTRIVNESANEMGVSAQHEATNVKKIDDMNEHTNANNAEHVRTFDTDPIYNDNDFGVYNDFQSTFDSNTDCDRMSGIKTEESQHTGEMFDSSMLNSRPSLGVDLDSYMDSDDSNNPNTNQMVDSDTNSHSRQVHNEDEAYIDFNNYPQNIESFPDETKRIVKVRSDRSVSSTNETAIYDLRQTDSSHVRKAPAGVDTLKRVRFAAARCVSQFDTHGGSLYEPLNRQTSCPNFEYSSSANSRASIATDFSTIAEAFSPSCDGSTQQGYSVDNCGSESDMHTNWDSSVTTNFSGERHQVNKKRNSYPRTGPEANKDTFKFARHSMPMLREKQKSTDSFVRARPLPELPRTSQRRQSESVRSGTPSSVFEHTEHSGGSGADNYKIVIGGKSSRPLMDASLANDRLFTHYNTELRYHAGWSPKETECTIDKTMEGVKHDKGFYVLWYHRSKKNLIITITNARSLLHFRVRTKVLDKTLHFYVSHSMMLPDVKQLLQYHHDYGLDIGNGHVAMMRLPIYVKYDRIAVSV